MKIQSRIDLKLPDDLKTRFAQTCERSGVKQSAVIRDLCEAAVAYAEANDGRLPRMIELADAAAGQHIPAVWLGRVLLKVRNLAELKDIVATVLVAGFALGWNSEIGPGANHLDELDAAVDRRLKEMRGKRG